MSIFFVVLVDTCFAWSSTSEGVQLHWLHTHADAQHSNQNFLFDYSQLPHTAQQPIGSFLSSDSI
jgi:hypothetical protein